MINFIGKTGIKKETNVIKILELIPKIITGIILR